MWKLFVGLLISIIILGKGYAQNSIKLICGFERQEIQAWANQTKSLSYVEVSEDTFQMQRLWGRLYDIVKSHASQGEYSLFNEIDLQEFAFRQTMLDPNRQPDGNFGDREWYIEKFGYLFQAFGWFRDIFNKDWSPWDYLWIDVTSRDANAVIRVIIEEKWIASDIRKFQIPAGQTVTIKFNLKDVAALCDIDLTNIVNFWITLQETDGPTKIFVDNIRLATSEAQKNDGIPFVTDDSPIEKRIIPSAYIEPIERPVFVKNTSTIYDKTNPVTINILNNGKEVSFLGGVGGYSGRHERAISAFDNDRILIIVMGRHNNLSGLYALATFDGGITWKGVDGTDSPTFIGNGHNICMRSIFEDSETGDAFITWMKYCYSGGGIANSIFQKITFLRDHWIIGPEIVCYDYVRSCPDLFSFTETSNGILWMALSNWNNAGPGKEIHAMFSTDEGNSWQRQNRAPLVNNSVPFAGGGPFLTPYKNQIACIFKTDWNKLAWSYNNGNQWIYKGLIDNTQSIPVSVVTAQDSIIFISINIDDKLFVIHLEGNSWYKEVIDDGSRGRVLRSILTVSNNSTFCFWAQEVNSLYNIYCRNYDISLNKWNKTVEVISGETDEIFNIAIPAHSPPNYIPLLYDSAPLFNLNSDKYWVKFARIPVEILTTVGPAFEENRPDVMNDFFLGRNYPNPFNSSTVIPYHIKKKNQKVSLSIFNVNGQLICELVNEYKDPGLYQVEWNGKDANGKDLSTGVYVCSFIVDHQIMNKKILLLR